jgi:hypothetical protein
MIRAGYEFDCTELPSEIVLARPKSERHALPSSEIRMFVPAGRRGQHFSNGDTTDLVRFRGAIQSMNAGIGNSSALNLPIDSFLPDRELANTSG